MKVEKKEKPSTKTNASEFTYESIRQQIRGSGPYKIVVNAAKRRLKAQRRDKEYVPTNEECKETDLNWIAARREEERNERHADEEENKSIRKIERRKLTPEELEAAELADEAEENKWLAEEPKRRRREDRECRRAQRLERRIDRKFEKDGIPPPSP